MAPSDCVAARLDVKRISIDVQLPQCMALRPREPAKPRDIINSSFHCLVRHVECHIDLNNVLKGEGGFEQVSYGPDAFDFGRPLNPREGLGILFFPVERPSDVVPAVP
jgi:hypothetical protein